MRTSIHVDRSRSRYIDEQWRNAENRENLHKFVQSLADDPICDELLVFCDKILHVWISSRKPHVCQKPGVGKCPTPGPCQIW